MAKFKGDRQDWNHNFQRHCAGVTLDLEGTNEVQEERLEYFKRKGDQQFTKIGGNHNWLGLTSPKMSGNKVNGPEDATVREMIKQLPQEKFTSSQNISRNGLLRGWRHQVSGRSWTWNFATKKEGRRTPKRNQKLQGFRVDVVDVKVVRVVCHFRLKEQKRIWKLQDVTRRRHWRHQFPALSGNDDTIAAELLGVAREQKTNDAARQRDTTHSVFGQHWHQDGFRCGKTKELSIIYVCMYVRTFRDLERCLSKTSVGSWKMVNEAWEVQRSDIDVQIVRFSWRKGRKSNRTISQLVLSNVSFRMSVEANTRPQIVIFTTPCENVDLIDILSKADNDEFAKIQEVSRCVRDHAFLVSWCQGQQCFLHICVGLLLFASKAMDPEFRDASVVILCMLASRIRIRCWFRGDVRGSWKSEKFGTNCSAQFVMVVCSSFAAWQMIEIRSLGSWHVQTILSGRCWRKRQCALSCKFQRLSFDIWCCLNSISSISQSQFSALSKCGTGLWYLSTTVAPCRCVFSRLERWSLWWVSFRPTISRIFFVEGESFHFFGFLYDCYDTSEFWGFCSLVGVSHGGVVGFKDVTSSLGAEVLAQLSVVLKLLRKAAKLRIFAFLFAVLTIRFWPWLGGFLCAHWVLTLAQSEYLLHGHRFMSMLFFRWLFSFCDFAIWYFDIVNWGPVCTCCTRVSIPVHFFSVFAFRDILTPCAHFSRSDCRKLSIKSSLLICKIWVHQKPHPWFEHLVTNFTHILLRVNSARSGGMTIPQSNFGYETNSEFDVAVADIIRDSTQDDEDINSHMPDATVAASCECKWCMHR